MDNSAANVKEFHVRLHDGDDVLNAGVLGATAGLPSSAGITQTIHAYGGSGHDQLFAAAGHDCLRCFVKH